MTAAVAPAPTATVGEGIYHRDPRYPATHSLAPRRVREGEPADMEYESVPMRGPSVRLRAVGGVIRPTTPEEVRLADHLGLPIIADAPAKGS